MTAESKYTKVIPPRPWKYLQPLPRHPTLEQWERFEKEKYYVGKGGYGKVYYLQNIQTGAFYAGKFFELKGNVKATILKEISLLKFLPPHPHIIHQVEVLPSTNSFVTIFEYCDNGDLTGPFGIGKTQLVEVVKDVIRRIQSHTERKNRRLLCKKYFFQIMAGLYHIHKYNVVHRDLKPDNILIDKEYNIKITDFGMARCIGSPACKLAPNAISLFYRPPEVLYGQRNYGTPVDIWSAGCILFQMIELNPLFGFDTGNLKEGEEKDREKLYLMAKHTIFKIRGTPTKETWPEFNELPGVSSTSHNEPSRKALLPKPWSELLVGGINDPWLENLLEHMLKLDPRARPSAAQILCHPYFDDLGLEVRKKIVPEINELALTFKPQPAPPPPLPQQALQPILIQHLEGIVKEEEHAKIMEYLGEGMVQEEEILKK